jgi:hypothetical protein
MHARGWLRSQRFHMLLSRASIDEGVRSQPMSDFSKPSIGIAHKARPSGSGMKRSVAPGVRVPSLVSNETTER